ncbi:hypothetical protein CAPTEDRAFT_189171 [Capitella teleta]|uniref:Uncharacterized protein n=1 Tax=Capitella teleta TaxID=283909 RepID=R7UXW7_CAPTE|nr:hypothetical protein CAPTEDRAFT_189171 [Capitella teleta]|eukprot:ELU08266.1 hypothetical protein CAPTEDRAFT_189171 [Capitella teleta]
MKADQERLVTVLKDTISLLCKNSLSYDHQVVVQGLVCVTIDKQDVVVVQINDQLGDAALEPCAGCGQGRRTEPSTPRELKKRRRPSESDGEEDDDSESSSKVPCHQQHTTLTGRIERQDDKSKVKSEQERSDEDEDLIMIDSEIKGESYSRTSYSEDNDSTYNNTPGADNSYISGFMDSSNMAAIAGSQGAVSEPHWSAGGQPPAGTQHLDNSDLTPNSQAGPSLMGLLQNLLCLLGEYLSSFSLYIGICPW